MYIHETGSPNQPTILFLHANGADSSMWQPHMRCLTGYHCLAVDFPGYGRSNREEWISLDQTTNQLIEIICNRAATGRTHLVGLSLGGSTAINLLGKAPELIDHAIIDGAGVLPLPGVTLQKIIFPLIQPLLHKEFFIKLLANAMKIPVENYPNFRSTMLAMSPSSFTRSFLQALSQRQPPGLEKAACRVLFVAGEKELQAVRESNEMLAKLLPNAAARIAPGMGHGWLAEDPDLHVAMVAAWLEDRPLPGALKVVE